MHWNLVQDAVTTDKNASLYVVKYAGAIFAALYGLYATVTDFHVDQDGKKVLTRKGYFGLGLLLLVSVLSISSDVVKDRSEYSAKVKQDIKDAAARKALDDQLRAEISQTTEIAGELKSQQSQLNRAVSTLDQNTETTRGVLQQTERILQPVKELTVGYDVLVPTDNPYLKSFLRDLKPLRPFRGSDGKIVCPEMYPDPPDSEKDPIAYEVLDMLGLQVAFYHQKVAPAESLEALDKAYTPGYRFETLTRLARHGGSGFHEFSYNSHGRLTMTVRGATLDSSTWAMQGFDMSSVPDLLGSWVLVTLGPQTAQPSTAASIRKTIKISKLALQMYGERQPFVLDTKNVKAVSNADGYPVYFGKFTDLFHLAPSPFKLDVDCE